ncbi:FAD-binding oxidoreductase [Parendozoicomonas sp. Alg238-R29]|uniref:FAD-binding oxidoreductase n=1 Tax=Parendozoicomonas sp. Alg238-R29 TaxID=2993446 RepID=UPI00248D43F3|nr:FAD-binding oxidoreductase [Parendozoicomonas sp. Alg238-R29]
MARPVYELELVESTHLAISTLGLVFHVDNPPEFEAGQFVSLLFEHNAESLKRSYSIASSPDKLRNECLLEIAIGLVPGGAASEHFANAKVGDKFQMSGPFGALTLPKDMPERLIMVGTGTGVAPYRSMFPQLEQLTQQGIKIHILMGARNRGNIFYREDFQSLPANSQPVIFETCLSREETVDPSAGEHKGYVQERLSKLDLTPEKDLVYLCGNPPMIDDTVKYLTDLGFGPRQIKREKYTFSR